MLNWDITDFGSGDFHKVGLLLFTVRNGNLKSEKYSKHYAEKLMIVVVGKDDPIFPLDGVKESFAITKKLYCYKDGKCELLIGYFGRQFYPEMTWWLFSKWMKK